MTDPYTLPGGQPDIPETREPQTFLGKTVDVLARTQYAAMGFLDTMIDSNGTAFVEAFREAGRELVAPDERRRFSDIIRKVSPGFASRNPKTTSVLGFVGDVALDPLTYVGTPVVTGGRKFAVKGLSRTAKYAAKNYGEAGALRQLARIGGKKGKERMVGLNRAGQEAMADVANEALSRGTILTKRGKRMAAKEAKRLRTKGFGKRDAWLLAEKRVVNLHQKGTMLNEATGAGVTRFDRHVAARMKNGMSMDDAILDTERVFDQMRAGNAFLNQRIAGVEPLAERVTPQIAWETAEKRINSLLNASPTKAKQWIEDGGLTFMGKKVIPGHQLRRMSDAIGLTRVKEILHDSYAGTAFRRAFSKADVPHELIIAHKNLAGRLEEATKDVSRVMKEHVGHLNAESRQKIGKLMHDVDSATAQAGKQAHEATRKYEAAKAAREAAIAQQDAWLKAGQVGPPPPTPPPPVPDIPHYNPHKIKQALLNDAKLTPEEHSAVASLYQVMNNLALDEARVGLLDRLRQNYFPRYWEVVRGGQELSGIRQKLHRYEDMAFFGPGEMRKITTIDEARKAGLDPIEDAGVVLAMRVMDHHQALAQHLFKKSSGEVVEKMEKAAVKGGLSPRQQKIALDRAQYAKRYVQMVGEGDYSAFSEKEVRAGLQFYDKMMSTFRRFATVARPAFGVRQFPSNHFQMFIGGGKNAIRHLWDPRVTFDAGAMLTGNAHKVRYTSVLGTTYTGDEVMAMARQYNILRNVTVDGVGHAPIINHTTAPKLMKEIHRNYKIRESLEKVAGKKGAEGMQKFFEKGLNYTHWPAAVEDFSRLQMFNNMLRAGHAPAQAAKLTDDALFDYLHGLSLVEGRVMRRIVPFYSFQRFAVPLILQAAKRAPGRISNATKAGRTLMEAYGKFDNNEDLTEAERQVIPGWILDQPHTFAGFDDEMRAVFKTFNNFTPLDVFGYMQTNETGDFDAQRTLLQASLSQLTPFVKVPAEMLLGEDFFTGRSLEDARNIGDVDLDKLLGHIAGVAVAGSAQAEGTLASGYGGIAAGALMSKILGALPMDGAKEKVASFMGIEEGVDRNGKRTVYVNAYAAHALTSMFPALQEAFKLSREDKTPVEKTERFLFGIPRFSMDLEEQKRFKLQEFQRGTRERQRDMRSAMIQQRMDAYAKAQQDLTEWIADWSMDHDRLMAGDKIRGAVDEDE
jgi:hypothetical protein